VLNSQGFSNALASRSANSVAASAYKIEITRQFPTGCIILADELLLMAAEFFYTRRAVS
jgi:hypothetical protein